MTEEGTVKIVVDKNKTAEEYLMEAEKFYIVPDLIRSDFPDLIKLIYETESMDEEEREYWLQIMPIMDKEQIEKFRGILVNEKEQLAELEQSSGGSSMDIPKSPALTEEQMKAKLQNIAEREKANEQSERDQEQELLKALENL